MNLELAASQSAEVAEGEVRTLQLSRTGPTDQPVTVGISTSSPADIEVLGGTPAVGLNNLTEITIPAGQTETTFNVLATSDGLDELQEETASVSFYNGTEFIGVELTIQDGDEAAITIAPTSEIPVGSGTVSFVVSRNAAPSTPMLTEQLVVQLDSSDPSIVSVPASVTLEPGRSFEVFSASVSSLASWELAAVTLTATVPETTASTTLDSAYGQGGKTVAFTSSQLQNAGYDLLAADSLGRSVVAVPTGGNNVAVRRFNPGGSADISFGSQGVVNVSLAGVSYAYPRTITVDAQDRVVIGVKEGSGTGSGYVVRLTESGTLDSSFGSDGVVNGTNGAGHWPEDIVVRDDGDLLITLGLNGTARLKLLQLNDDGSQDAAFGLRDYSDIGWNGEQAQLLSDGSAVIVGRTWLAKVDASGQLVESFGINGEVTLPVGDRSVEGEGIAIDAAGRIVVAAHPYDVVSGSIRPDIGAMRFLSDGTLDTTFGDGGTVFTSIAGRYSYGQNIALDAAGRVYIGGLATSDTDPFNRDAVLVRYTADGQLDSSFFGDGIVLDPMSQSQDGYAVRGIAVTGDKVTFVAGWNTDIRVGQIEQTETSDSYDDAVTIEVSGPNPPLTFTTPLGTEVVAGESLDLTLTRDAEFAGEALTVSIDVGSSIYLTGPASVNFEAGQMETIVTVVAADVDIPPTHVIAVDVIATVNDWQSATTQVVVLPSLSTTPSFIVTPEQATVGENGQFILTITQDRRLATDTTYSLTTDDSELLPENAEVTIVAGQNSVDVVITGVQDNLFDGLQAVEIEVATEFEGVSVSKTTLVEVFDQTQQQYTFGRNLNGREIREGEVTSFEVTMTAAYEIETSFRLELPDAFVEEFGNDIEITPLVLEPGATSGFIDILGIDDGIDEPNEQFRLRLAQSWADRPDRFFGAAFWVLRDPVLEPTVTLSTSTLEEGGLAATGQIDLGQVLDQSIAVNFFIESDTGSSGTSDEIQIPQQVIIPAGERFGSFEIAALDDYRVDGIQTEQLRATFQLPGEERRFLPLPVTTVDNEVAELTLILDVGQGPFPLPDGQPTEFTEGQRVVAVVRHNLDVRHPLYQSGFDVQTSGGDTLGLPGTMTVEPTRPFAFAFLDNTQDNVVEDDQEFFLSALADGFESSTLEATLFDDDEAEFGFTDQFSLIEGDMALFGFGTGGGLGAPVVFDHDVTLTLTSSDPTRLEVLVPTIVLPAGQVGIGTQDAFVAVNDDLFAGDTAVTLTGTIEGYESLVATVEITEDESLYPPFLDVQSGLIDEGETLTARLFVSPLAFDATVSLQSSDPETLLVPLEISIPAGTPYVDVPLSAFLDGVVDDDQLVTITGELNAPQLEGFDQLTLSASVTVINVNFAAPPVVDPIVGPGMDQPGRVGELVSLQGSFQDALEDAHTVTIDWGDGTIVTLQADAIDQTADTFAADHIYQSGGVFDVDVTVDDGTFQVSQNTTVVIAGYQIDTDGRLRFIGSEGDDELQIKAKKGQLQIRTRIDGGSWTREDVDMASVTSVYATLGEGDDRVAIDRKLDIPAIVLGGGGNDRIETGAGNDILIGGLGADDLSGRNGEDLLISADFTQTFDESTLFTILDIWTGEEDFADRVQLLSEGIADTLVAVRPGDTVVSDAEIDLLHGDGDTDWLIGGQDDTFRAARKDRVDRI